MKLDTFFKHTNKNSEGTTDLKVRARTRKLLEENLCDYGEAKLSSVDTKRHEKREINNLKFFKIKKNVF